MLGIGSLAWNIMHCKAPKEVVDSIDSAIVSSGMLKEMLLQNQKGTVYLFLCIYRFDACGLGINGAVSEYPKWYPEPSVTTRLSPQCEGGAFALQLGALLRTFANPTWARA